MRIFKHEFRIDSTLHLTYSPHFCVVFIDSHFHQCRCHCHFQFSIFYFRFPYGTRWHCIMRAMTVILCFNLILFDVACRIPVIFIVKIEFGSDAWITTTRNACNLRVCAACLSHRIEERTGQHKPTEAKESVTSLLIYPTDRTYQISYIQ